MVCSQNLDSQKNLSRVKEDTYFSISSRVNPKTHSLKPKLIRKCTYYSGLLRVYLTNINVNIYKQL